MTVASGASYAAVFTAFWRFRYAPDGGALIKGHDD